MDKEQIVDYLAALDGDEFAALVSEARPPKGNVVRGVGNVPSRDSVQGSAIQAAEAAGNWNESFALKAAKLNEMMRKHS